MLGNYTAVLAAAGWLDADGLAGQLVAWRTWLDLLQPDLLIADHAPTAVLAARGLGIPIWAVGNSFQIPPKGEHFPPMLYWDSLQAEKCPSYDSIILPIANRALVSVGSKPLSKLTEIFDGVHQAIVTVPELAHYQGYAGGAQMVGPS